jgi:hypothetical protein
MACTFYIAHDRIYCQWHGAPQDPAHCCLSDTALEQLAAYQNDRLKRNSLAVATAGRRRPGRRYGWRRWLRRTYCIPDALYAAHRARKQRTR